MPLPHHSDHFATHDDPVSFASEIDTSPKNDPCTVRRRSDERISYMVGKSKKSGDVGVSVYPLNEARVEAGIRLYQHVQPPLDKSLLISDQPSVQCRSALGYFTGKNSLQLGFVKIRDPPAQIF
jgi:hypothetical protein